MFSAQFIFPDDGETFLSHGLGSNTASQASGRAGRWSLLSFTLLMPFSVLWGRSVDFCLQNAELPETWRSYINSRTVFKLKRVLILSVFSCGREPLECSLPPFQNPSYEQVHLNLMFTVQNSGHFLILLPLDTHLACWKCILAHQVSRPVSEYFCSSQGTRFSRCSTKYSLVQDPGRILLVRTYVVSGVM